MSVRITSQEDVVALFDGVTGQAFGTVFESAEDADEFLEFARPRCIAQGGVRGLNATQFGALIVEWEEFRVYYTVHPFADEWTWEPDTGGREPWVTTLIAEAVEHAIQVKREYIEVTPEADWQDTFWSLVYASDRRPRMGGPWEGVAVGWVDPWGEYHQGDEPPLDDSGSYLAKTPCS